VFFLSEVCFVFSHFEQPENYSLFFTQCYCFFFVKFEPYHMYTGLLTIRWSESLSCVLHIFFSFLHLSPALCFFCSVFSSQHHAFSIFIQLFQFSFWDRALIFKLKIVIIHGVSYVCAFFRKLGEVQKKGM
jgi:hypothetical protein